jgi:hypothetical protein
MLWLSDFPDLWAFARVLLALLIATWMSSKILVKGRWLMSVFDAIELGTEAIFSSFRCDDVEYSVTAGLEAGMAAKS